MNSFLFFFLEGGGGGRRGSGRIECKDFFNHHLESNAISISLVLALSCSSVMDAQMALQPLIFFFFFFF